MGEFPARIVAEDFLTPPEFADWRLAHEGSGRIGGARLALHQRDGATRLTQVYQQIPVRVLPLDLGGEEPTLVYLLNPTAGLMDGDAHGMDIHAGAGTRAVVTGQSATRIHPSTKGYCTQQWKISVADDAVLVVLPGPAIPYAGCRFFQRVHIDLAVRAHLVWGDLWFAGRYARGEVSECFRFKSVIQEMQIHRQGQLVYRDRFHWHGPWDETTAHWHFAGQPAAGTIFVSGAIEQAFLQERAEVRTAMFTTAFGDTCWRCTGSSAAVIRSVVLNCLCSASLRAGGSCDKPWLVGGHHLATTHWFDVAQIRFGAGHICNAISKH